MGRLYDLSLFHWAVRSVSCNATPHMPLQLSRQTWVGTLVSNKTLQLVIIRARAWHRSADWHFCHVNVTAYDALQIGFTVPAPPGPPRYEMELRSHKCSFKEFFEGTLGRKLNSSGWIRLGEAAGALCHGFPSSPFQPWIRFIACFIFPLKTIIMWKDGQCSCSQLWACKPD